MRSLLALSALAFLAACNVATVDQAPSTIARNECSSDSECAGGVCFGKQCRSRNGSLSSLLFEVTPPSDGTTLAGAGVQFLVPRSELPSAGGRLDLDLPPVAQFSGKVIADRACSPKFLNADGMESVSTADHSVPVVVTFSPSASTLGLYSPRAVAVADLPNKSSWAFSANLSPGPYDLYIEPFRQPTADCPVPPRIIRGYPVSSGSTNPEIALPEPAELELTVVWPAGDGALNGWTADIVDFDSGRVVSNRRPLSVGAAGKSDYVATLAFSPVVKDNKPTGDELIRLSPPEGTTAPTVLLARQGLSLFEPGKARVLNFTSLPVPVRVSGQVTARSTPEPVAASVTLVATEVAGMDSGLQASLVRTVEVGSDGQFEVELLPGTYRVTAVPNAELDAKSPLASASTTWEIPTNPAVQAGRVIELVTSLPVSGKVLDASGATAMSTALVQAAPSASSIQINAWNLLLGNSSYVPRSSSTSVNALGDFALSTDAGKYDLTVRPITNTGFGWLVLPGVPIGVPGANSAGLNFNRLQVPLAVSYAGTATVDGNARLPVPGALIRAYAYIVNGGATNAPAQADSVLQVGETRADEYGNFDILIPAALNEAFSAKSDAE